MTHEDAAKAADNDMTGWVSEAITDDPENWPGKNSAIYLVKDLGTVRAALIKDYTTDTTAYDSDGEEFDVADDHESVAQFLDRHWIDWE